MNLSEKTFEELLDIAKENNLQIDGRVKTSEKIIEKLNEAGIFDIEEDKDVKVEKTEKEIELSVDEKVKAIDIEVSKHKKIIKDLEDNKKSLLKQIVVEEIPLHELLKISRSEPPIDRQAMSNLYNQKVMMDSLHRRQRNFNIVMQGQGAK